VGDPQQLPATVLSSKAQRHHLAQSLFERLQRVRSRAYSVCLP
jgi:superfamily I DNA and/or RNA helicase